MGVNSRDVARILVLHYLPQVTPPLSPCQTVREEQKRRIRSLRSDNLLDVADNIGHLRTRCTVPFGLYQDPWNAFRRDREIALGGSSARPTEITARFKLL